MSSINNSQGKYEEVKDNKSNSPAIPQWLANPEVMEDDEEVIGT